MTRTRTLFAILAPALVAGGIVAVSATSTRADDDQDEQEAREAEREAREAEREAARHQKEAHKAQQQAMKEARKEMKRARQHAREQLEEARRQIEAAPLSDKMKQKILKRLDEAAEKIEAGMDKADSGDWDGFEAEMEAMGEAMEAMGEEFEHFGDGWDDWAKQFDGNGGAIVIDPDNFDFDSHGMVVIPKPPRPPTPPTPPTPPDPPAIDMDLSDLDIVIDVQDLSLGADQVEQLHIIFQSEQDVLEPARERLEDLSEQLRDALESSDADEHEIERMVDAINAEEGKIRKAQILAWVKSRKLLDDDQQDKVEKAKVKVKKAKAPRRVR